MLSLASAAATISRYMCAASRHAKHDMQMAKSAAKALSAQELAKALLDTDEACALHIGAWLEQCVHWGALLPLLGSYVVWDTF